MPIPNILELELAPMTVGASVSHSGGIWLAGTSLLCHPSTGTIWMSGGGGSTSSTSCYSVFDQNYNFITTSTTLLSVGNTYFIIDEEVYMENQEYYDLARQRGVMFQIRTAEQRAREEEAFRQAQIVAQRREEERKAAIDRSRQLLLDNLTDDQRKSFENKRWFIVIGGKTKTRYRINGGGSVTGNIDVLAGGAIDALLGKYTVVHRLCCHLRDTSIPHYDHYLAQKIGLMYNEREFVRMANKMVA